MVLKQGKLLVVDDDENNRDMLSRRLARQGYTVEVAEGGSQALEKLNAAQYDLVLLDQMMPGMSGLDLLHLLRATRSQSDLPVIMVTAMDQSQGIVDALNGGANDCVTKPVDMPIVSARIESQLLRSRAERQVRASEERYALAARSGSDGVWDINLATGEAYVSPEWIDLLGYGPDEVGNTVESWLNLIHPEDRDRVRGEIYAISENRTDEFHTECRLRNKWGSYRCILARGTAKRTAGKPVRLAGSFTDLALVKFSDSTTGLGNRRMFLDRVGDILAVKPGEPARPFAVVRFDLDRFKSIHENYSEKVGGAILVEIGQRLREAIADGEFDGAPISRIEGGEFALLLIGARTAEQVNRLVESILARLTKPLAVDGQEFTFLASAGIVMAPPQNQTEDMKPEDLLRNAELAMHQARAMGWNRFQIFDRGMRERALTRMALSRDLRYAVERNQLVALYQANVNLATGRVVGFEALMRWRHPERGTISPVDFIPLAEDNGLIVPVGEWILLQATRQLANWQRACPRARELSMNVNLSVVQLTDPGLVNRIREILEETGIPPHTLKLELTESSLMTDVESATAVLCELRAMGIGLNLDDFGTGYSSLSYLRSLHFDSLKIDKSFIAKMTTDPETHAIVDTIIKLAHALDMTVVAEGIEQQDQKDELTKLGCDVAQGFYFSEPVDTEAAEKIWTSNPFLTPGL